MINELYKLFTAMSVTNVSADIWSKNYMPLPKITENNPCYSIIIQGGKVLEISSVNDELGKLMRKYGYKNTFPIMNFKPLYRITDSSINNELHNLCNSPETLDSNMLQKIQSWCTVNNWDKKFCNKYRVCMVKRVNELKELVPDYEPLNILIEESGHFAEPQLLHKELKDRAFSMLAERKDISITLGLLFSTVRSEKKNNDTIMIAVETQRLIEKGIPAISYKFVKELNAKLIEAEKNALSAGSNELDVFGQPYCPTKERMHAVKLGTFTAKLRTMNEDQKCHHRYGQEGSASYPVSITVQNDLAASLGWLGGVEQKGKTWIDTDKFEILFAYPEYLEPSSWSDNSSFVNTFLPDGESLFKSCAKNLIDELRRGKKPDTDSTADGLQIFILKKVDDARTKIIYSHHTDARELEKLSEKWTKGVEENLPEFRLGKLYVIFPATAADVLNRFWKQSGERIRRKDKDGNEKKIKIIPKYHGIELMLEPDVSAAEDIHLLAEQTTTLGAYIGNQIACNLNKFYEQKSKDVFSVNNVKDMLSLAGILLYRAGIRKEKYMKDIPYLLGQLLKVSDELHALYCRVFRDGQLPAQLIGSGLYRSAAESPVSTLGILGIKMSPYITWAKSYRYKKEGEDGKDSRIAGWLLSLYENIMQDLEAAWKQPNIHFSDAEKAQLFIGYLAKFPRKEDVKPTLNENNENNTLTEETINE